MLAEMNIYDIYVSNNVSLLQLIYIRWDRKNIQHSMLFNPEYNNISIDNYKREIFQIFMLELRLYIPYSSTLVYLEVISKIKYQIFTSKTLFYYQINAKEYEQQIC